MELMHFKDVNLDLFIYLFLFSMNFYCKNHFKCIFGKLVEIMELAHLGDIYWVFFLFIYLVVNKITDVKHFLIQYLNSLSSWNIA